MWGAIKDRWIRATELADAAKGGGNWKIWGKGRGALPEFGVGEFLRGFVGKELHQTDAADPNFQKNLTQQIERDVKPENQALFDRDFKVAEEQKAAAHETAKADARQAWLDKTSRSPAAASGAFT